MQSLVYQALETFKDSLAANPCQSLSKLLPLLLSLEGKPYSLRNHFPFEPIFRIHNVPRRLILKAGRQVSKSTSLAASQIIKAYLQSYYNILTVTPLSAQASRFSNNYVKPFLLRNRLPHKKFINKTDPINSVLQRSLPNGSILFYNYSCGDPNRIRGIKADEIDTDEIQDFDLSDLPIIEQCMAASDFKLLRMSGTPKTRDNTIEVNWLDSSQAHWHIDCQETGCKYENNCCVDGDLLKMLGDETLICAKCGKPVDSRSGYFVHDYPLRQMDFAGYHIPQPIFPMHYAKSAAWKIIKEFQARGPMYAFYNEVLGESYDIGAKIITSEQVKAAAIAPVHKPNEYPKGRFQMTVVGVDWGGRGKEKTNDTEEHVSNTAVSVAGLRGDGVIEINWLYKVPYEFDLKNESVITVETARLTHADFIAADYGGQGNVQQTLLEATGWPPEYIIPFTYTRMGMNKPIVHYEESKDTGVRSSFSLDKARSILLLCELIKQKRVLLPQSDEYINNHLHDFLNIIEETTESPTGLKWRLVKRLSRRTDDIVHAINFAVMAIYHYTGQWPEIARVFSTALNEAWKNSETVLGS